MKKLTCLTVIGTRPEAIKMAPVIKGLAAETGIKSIVCATAQHREMLDSVLSLFRITPDFDLNIMRPGQSLADVTAEVLQAASDVIAKVRPDVILVQGDTTTTLAVSLAAYYHKSSVGHVEAGLRTHNIYAPWPEEVNRKVTSAIARYHFVPTDMARGNLLAEGVDPSRIFLTGNTVIDALLDVTAGIKADADFVASMQRQYPFLVDVVTGRKQMVLVTAHRRESFGEGFEQICQALRRLADRSDAVVVYPVHLNPNVREPVFRILGGLDNVRLLPPLDYRPFVYFMSICRFILTDSGGVQEEAPSLGKPVLVMREVTERGEAVDAGTVKLVGTDTNRIVDEAEPLFSDTSQYRRMSRIANPYGDGNAAARIVEILLRNSGATSLQ